MQIGRILERLDEREQKIIISRFGLDHDHEPLTLKEVGAEMGVTKERIRQMRPRAAQVRLAAQEEKIEVPGLNCRLLSIDGPASFPGRPDWKRGRKVTFRDIFSILPQAPAKRGPPGAFLAPSQGI